MSIGNQTRGLQEELGRQIQGEQTTPAQSQYEALLKQMQQQQVAAARTGAPAGAQGLLGASGQLGVAAQNAPVGTGMIAEEDLRLRQLLQGLQTQQGMEQAGLLNLEAMLGAQQQDFEKRLEYERQMNELRAAQNFYGSLTRGAGNIVGLGVQAGMPKGG